MQFDKTLDWGRNKISNLIRVRDIFFFVLGAAAASFLAFHIYQWRMSEAQKVGAIVFDNSPYVFKLTTMPQ